VEPRLSVERWISPFVTVGVAVGVDALRARDVSAGVYLQGHLRAFDRTRRRPGR
jgi:hypothetical protein